MSNAQQQAAYQQAYQQYQQAQAQYQQQQQQQPSTTQYNQKFKSTLCNVWLMEGVCPRGRVCHYAHGVRELNYNQYYNYWPSATASPNAGMMGGRTEEYQSRYYKTAICQFWQQKGICNNGDQCKWAHGEHELRRPELQQQTNGYQQGQEGGEAADDSKVLIGPQRPPPTASAEQQQQGSSMADGLTSHEAVEDNNGNGNGEDGAAAGGGEDFGGDGTRKRNWEVAGLGEEADGNK